MPRPAAHPLPAAAVVPATGMPASSALAPSAPGELPPSAMVPIVPPSGTTPPSPCVPPSAGAARELDAPPEHAVKERTAGSMHQRARISTRRASHGLGKDPSLLAGTWANNRPRRPDFFLLRRRAQQRSNSSEGEDRE